MNIVQPGGLDHCVALHLGLTVFGVFCTCSLLVLFQCLISLFFFTVKPQCNEVFPSFGIGVFSAKLTHWEISAFSCWQSIYLPSNVEYVCGMNREGCGKMEDRKHPEITARSYSL